MSRWKSYASGDLLIERIPKEEEKHIPSYLHDGKEYHMDDGKLYQGEKVLFETKHSCSSQFEDNLMVQCPTQSLTRY